jgi:hypothetical protein
MSSLTSVAAVRPLGLSGRFAVLGLVVLGAIVAASSALALVLFVPYASVGALLVMRPRMSIVWLLLGLAGSFASITTTLDATIQQFADGTVGLPLVVLAVLMDKAPLAVFLLFAILALVFPSGWLPTGRWGTVVRLALAMALLLLIATLIWPNLTIRLVGYTESVAVRNPRPPAGSCDLAGHHRPRLHSPVLLILVVAAISLVVRARRATGIERQQLRWFTASIAFVVVAVLAGMALSFIVPGVGVSGLVWIPAEVTFALVPIAVGIAVLRYRLFEIDRIISRTLSWALVTGVLMVTFAGGVIALQAVLADFTQGATLAIAGSTLIAFALFQPVRRRVQRAVDRRFDRARYDGQRVIDTFARQLRDEVDLDRLRTALIATADDVVRPVSASVWLRSREAAR